MNTNHNNLTDNDNTINNGSKDQTVVDDFTNTPNIKNISKGSTISGVESQGLEYNRKSAEMMDGKNQILPVKNKVKG